MNDDERFFERLRTDARELRYQPADDAIWTRLQARIRQQVQSPPGVSQLLAGWFRPLAASLAALSLIAALGLRWIERTPDPVTVETMVASADPPTDIGDSFSVE